MDQIIHSWIFQDIWIDFFLHFEFPLLNIFKQVGTACKNVHSGPRGGKSKKINVLKSAYTKASLKVDKISDTTQKKLTQ